MAAELGLLSLTQLQKLAQSQRNQHHPNVTGSYMWNPKQPQEEDDSWEVRAFAEDTGNIMGTTWPPRSYTCTFCRREFRSAQALGGHMNVHRRDRARLHHTQHGPLMNNPSSSSSSSAAVASPSSTLIIPTQEFARNGLCLLYPLTNTNGVFTTSTMNACGIDTQSTLLSVSPYPPIGQPSVNFQVVPQGFDSACQSYSPNGEPSTSLDSGTNVNNNCKDSAVEELDLELRLGNRPEASSS